MGRWGNEIYDNDTASDWAAETCRNLLDQVAEIINDDDLSIIDFDLIFAPIDVVCYLCEHADIVPFQDPDVLNWRPKLLKVFASETEELGWEAEDIASDKKRIEGIFDRLETAVESSGAPDRWDPEPGSMWHQIQELEQQYRESPPKNLRRWDEAIGLLPPEEAPSRSWWQFWRKR